MKYAEVLLWKTRIGVISISDNSPYCTFMYDPEFIGSNINVAPLMMPLSNVIYEFKSLSLDSFKGLPGLLSDSLPDRYGNALIDAWLAENGRSIESFNVIDRLCYIGTRGMGALEFAPDMSRDFNESEVVEINQLVELSNQILNHKEEITKLDKDSLNEIISVGTSAGGARAKAKAIIAYNEKTGEIKSGQITAGVGFSYWILKLDGVDQKEETSHTRIEYAYYLMALASGIDMSESRLLKKEHYYHFMTKCFDRIESKNGTVDKVHMQTLGALMHRDYNEPGTLSFEEAARAMSQIGLKQSEVEQFYKRMVFNIMCRNQEDHVKNISFLMDRRGTWSLSPAYDVTFAYNPNGSGTAMHQMVINGKRSHFNRDDLLQSANAMNINKNHALEIIDEVKQAMMRWSEFSKQAFLSEEVSDFVKNQFISID